MVMSYSTMREFFDKALKAYENRTQAEQAKADTADRIIDAINRLVLEIVNK